MRGARHKATPATSLCGCSFLTCFGGLFVPFLGQGEGRGRGGRQLTSGGIRLRAHAGVQRKCGMARWAGGGCAGPFSVRPLRQMQR